MEVRIDKRFDLPVSVEQAWGLLCDVRATGSCMPGVEVTEQIGDSRFKGVMRTRIGPATMNFSGHVEVLERDDGARSLRMIGKGGDTSGSSATMNLLARIEPGAIGDTSVLVGATTVAVSGKLAQFGSRMLLPVAETMLRSFVANFAQRARLMPLEASAPEQPAQASHPTSEPPPLSLARVAWVVVQRWFANLFGRPGG